MTNAREILDTAVTALYRLLTNPETDPERRETARNVVAALIGQGDAE